MTERIRYSPEVRKQALPLMFEHESIHDSQWSTIRSISEMIGCTGVSLRSWGREAELIKGVALG